MTPAPAPRIALVFPGTVDGVGGAETQASRSPVRRLRRPTTCFAPTQ